MLRCSVLLAAAAAALSALAVTSCGSAPIGPAGGTSAASPSPSIAAPAEQDLAAVVRTAAALTARQSTAKFTVEVTATAGGARTTVRGEGAYDTQRRTGQLRFDVPGADGSPAGGGSVVQRTIGADVYLTLPQQPDAFFRLPASGLGATSLAMIIDPTASLQALVGLRDVVEIGAAEVRGVQATAYRGTYDVAGALAAVQGPARAVLEAMLRSTDQSVVSFDAHIDGEGHVVRLEQQLALGDQPALRTVLELYDLGTIVVVRQPPADRVRDGGPLLAALVAALPAPTPAVPVPSAPPLPAATPEA